MVFSSILFLFLYLPIVLALYNLIILPRTLGSTRRVWLKAGNVFLLLVSLVFYAWGGPTLIWIGITSIIVDFVAALAISGAYKAGPIQTLVPGGPRTRAQKIGLVLSICSNLAFLGYFKYFNFGVDSYNGIVAWLGIPQAEWQNVARVTLPLGISFYTFHSLSYTIDVYLGNATATRNLADFAMYVMLFPQLVAGPIVRYRDVAAMVVNRFVTREGFAYGIHRFVIGLGKKVLIANTVAVMADKVFALPNADLTPGLAWLGVMCYTLQIYFDFSGYSDMAIGMGHMFGFKFLENFDYPYVSTSIQEFWRRWHISLSRWFRDFLYIPLGGNRISERRTYFNLVTVFFLCGLWHGASWTFVIWGLYHGMFLVLERMGLGDFVSKRPILGHVYTILVVMVGWVLFRSESFPQSLAMLSAMAGFASGSGTAYSVARYFTTDIQIAFVAGAILSLPVVPAFTRLKNRLIESKDGLASLTMDASLSTVHVVGLMLILALSAINLASGTHNPFIYFRF
jgi:alginate O-acetyltransferase complex protein AlgI